MTARVTSRERIPVEHRSIIRTNVRFDRRDTTDAGLLRYLAEPDKRSARIHELLRLGFEVRQNMREVAKAATSRTTSHNQE